LRRVSDVALALISGLAGAVLVGGVEFGLRRRDDHAELRAAARLVLEELRLMASTLDTVLRRPELLPTLDRERSPIRRDAAWQENKLALARLVRRDIEWHTIRTAYGAARVIATEEEPDQRWEDIEVGRESVRDAIAILERRMQSWWRRGWRRLRSTDDGPGDDEPSSE
jgi:hypothetical protein